MAVAIRVRVRVEWCQDSFLLSVMVGLRVVIRISVRIVISVHLISVRIVISVQGIL